MVDSILRRKQKYIAGIKNPVYRGIQKSKYKRFSRQIANRLLKVWIEYNRRILENLKNQDEQKFLVIHESELANRDFAVFQYVRHNWNYRNTCYIPIKKIFVSGLFQKETAKYQFDSDLLERAKEITRELDRLQDETALQLSIHAQAKAV